jgi:hypothetical protein
MAAAMTGKDASFCCVLVLFAAAAVLASAEAGAQPRAATPPWKDPAGPPTEIEVWLRRLVGRYQVEGLVEVAYDYEGYPDHRCGPLPPDPAEQDNPPPLPVPYCSSIGGMADCVGIGAGPGVQCILGITWKEIWDVDPDEGVFTLPGGVPNLAPAMMLFGLAPGQSNVDYLLVDNKGLPEGGLGSIGGSRVTFTTPCTNAPTLFQTMKPPPVPAEPPNLRTSPRTCERTLRLEARDGAKVVHLSIGIEINGDLWTRYEMSLRRVAQGR